MPSVTHDTSALPKLRSVVTRVTGEAGAEGEDAAAVTDATAGPMG